MSDLILELQKRRDQLQKNAQNHKERRDHLNDKTREWVRRRDELNKKIRQIIAEANEHKEKRDFYNKEVQKYKAERDAINKEVAKAYEKLMRLKKEATPHKKGEVPISKLKKELKKLEFKQMTEALSAEDEKKLVEKINLLSQTIKTREAKEETPEIRQAKKEYEEIKQKAEEAHRKLQEVAELAQIEHERMSALYKKSETLIREAENAQRELVRSKIEADKEHNIAVELVKQIHELERIIMGLRQKQKYAKKSKKEVDNRMQAKEIFKRFKEGEKLSTEDIMLLQKTGFL